MKAIFRLLLLLCTTTTLLAQFPPLSPKATIQQAVGNTNITLEYTRPIARGRQIFGDLVAYGEPWQTGAGATFLRFDRPVTIGGTALPAGGYALVTIPDKTEWTVIIHEAEHGSMRYDKSAVKAQVCVAVSNPGRFYEALSIEFDLSQAEALMFISWTNVQVSIPIKTTTTTTIMAEVDSLIADRGPYVEESYFRAANYLLFNDLEPAKTIALVRRMQEHNAGEHLFRMLIRAHLAMGNNLAALQAVEEGIAAVRKEYPEGSERHTSLMSSYNEQRVQIMLGKGDGRKVW